MPDAISPPPSATVTFTVEDALKIAQSIGALTVVVNPAAAGAVAVVTGAAELLRNTILPIVQQFHDRQLSVAEQATLQAESAAERARVGAPPAAVN